MAWMRRGIVTLVTFVWLFSTVHLQMLPQIVCPRRCIVTLVAFVWFNDIASCFLQDICILQTKVIIVKILLHCECTCIVFCPNGCFKLSQIYLWLLVFNNYNCLVFHDILSLFHNWTANVLVGANTCINGHIYEKCHAQSKNLVGSQILSSFEAPEFRWRVQTEL